jgi:hypothetical protein
MRAGMAPLLGRNAGRPRVSRLLYLAPTVVLVLPLVPLAALGILHDARLGVIAVLLAIPFGFAAIQIGLFNLQAVLTVALLT